MSERHLDLTLAQLDRLSSFYPRVEGKSAFVLALNFAMASVVTLNFQSDLLSSIEFYGPLGIFTLLITLSTLRVVETFFPHLAGSIQQSHTYFGDIAKRSCEDFLAEWAAITPEERLKDAVLQIWRNSQILELKFKASKRAFIFTILASLPWVWLVGLLAIAKGKLDLT